jgi:PAS domain S-box-containing protein
VAGNISILGVELTLRRCLTWVAWLNLAFASSSAAQPGARQVLLLNSFERGSAVENLFAGTFRTELGRQSPEPINFFEVSLQAALTPDHPQEEPVVDYLLSTFTGQPLDLVVTLGGPAAAFAQKYRERLFPATPLLLAAVDRRSVQDWELTPNATALTVATDPPQMLESVLRLLPETTNIFVVIGASGVEEFWRGELSRWFRPFEDRVTFIWSNELSFPDILKCAASLPPHSAIFYVLLSADANGVLQAEERTLAELHAVANAPVFGLYDIQLGHGIVGGSLLSVKDLVQTSASVALRILRGESPGNIKTAAETHGQPTYDWRELQRWGISEAHLPAGSIVQFRQPSVLDQYKSYIVGAAVLLGLQSALIAGLVVQRARRRRMEVELRESEERFRLMANGAPVMVWTARPDKETDFFNSTVLEVTGLPIEQLLGNGWLEHVHPEDIDQCVRTYVPAFDARQPFQMEYRFRRADGTYRWVFDTGVPRYRPDGSFAGYIGSALDITDRKQTEAALRRSYEHNQDLVGRLINAQEAERMRIARDLHDDLSQQLASVGIALSGLKGKVGKPDSESEVEQAVTTLQDRTSALAETVRNLSHELHPGVLEHAGLVATLRRHCADVEQHHHVRVTFSARDDLDSLSPDVALCLFRVTQEALTNAIRHARPRAVLVQLMATDEGAELSVIDDGIGFVTSERAGSGLGLRSIDERVRLTGGNARVESRPGQGTKVLVRIPLTAAQVELC